MGLVALGGLLCCLGFVLCWGDLLYSVINSVERCIYCGFCMHIALV